MEGFALPNRLLLHFLRFPFKRMAEDEQNYDFSTIEKNGRNLERENTFKARSIRQTVTGLTCSPTFGCHLHIGHPEGYVVPDILARYKKSGGYNVLRPWDGTLLVYRLNSMPSKQAQPFSHHGGKCR